MEMKLQKLLLWGVYALPLIVFVTFGYLSFPAITEKSFAFRILVEILFGIWLILALRNPVYRPKLSWILLVLFDFLIIISIANYFGADPYKSFWSNLERMEGYITLLHLLAYFVLLTSVLQSKENWRRFFLITISSSVIVAAVGLLQYTGVLEPVERATSVFGNSSYLAVYLLFHIFFTSYLWIQERISILKNTLFGGALIILITGLISTGSRGALLALIVSGIVTSLIIVLAEKDIAHYRRRAIVLLALLIISTSGIFLLKNTAIISESPTLSRLTSVSLTEGTAQHRLIVWDIALQGIQEHQMLGWGQENFEIVFNKYYNPELAGAELWFDRTHNIFLEWLIAGGAFGVSFFLGIFFFAFIVLWRRVKTLNVTSKAMLTGALIAYIVQGQFTSDTLISYLFLFTLIAYIHYLAQVPWREFLLLPKSDNTDTYTIRGMLAPTLVGILTVLIICSVNYKALASDYIFMKGYGEVQTNPKAAYTYFDRALQYNSYGTPEMREVLLFQASYIKKGNAVDTELQDTYTTRAFSEMDTQIRERPDYTRYPLHAAYLSAITGKVDQAVGYWVQAKRTSPAKEKIYIDEGVALYNYGRFEEALDSFQIAYGLAPDRADIAQKYVNAAFKVLGIDESKNLVEEVYGTTTPAQAFLIPLYKDIGDAESILIIYTHLIEAEPENLQNYISKAATLHAIGRTTEAITILEIVKQKDPETIEEIDYYISALQNQ